jgi:iron complex outermembrane receptor protein
MMFKEITRLMVGLVLLLSCFSLHAQPQPTTSPGGSGAPEPKKARLQGQLINTETNAPLEFATVSLYALPDSALIDGSLTDIDGKFELSAEPGNYYLIAQFVGFENQVVPDITVERGQRKVDLGIIGVSESAVDLAEIEVTAERSQMTFKLDRRVFNVGKDLTNAGATAADILDNVPSITVDVEGNVSLRGSQNVRILINGKPSGLVGVGDIEALRRMQGDIIERIEVITNPSARYEAEGEAGIINIILKKDQKKGVNGSIGLNTGFPHNHGASYNLNYRQSNLNLFSNFGVSYRAAPGGGFTTQRFFDDNGDFELGRNIDRDSERGGWGANIQVGADWLIDDFSTLTGSMLYKAGKDDNNTIIQYRDFDEFNNTLGSSVRTDNEIEDEHNIEGVITYRREFEEKDRELVIDFRYILDDETERSDFFSKQVIYWKIR